MVSLNGLIPNTQVLKPSLDTKYISKSDSMSQASQPRSRDFVLFAEELERSGRNKLAFLNAAACTQSFNLRHIFFELISIPSFEVIERYSANELVHRWVISTTEDGVTEYFRIDIGAVNFYATGI